MGPSPEMRKTRVVRLTVNGHVGLVEVGEEVGPLAGHLALVVALGLHADGRQADGADLVGIRLRFAKKSQVNSPLLTQSTNGRPCFP